MYAGVAELADALDLGSSAFGCMGSTPFTCTITIFTKLLFTSKILFINICGGGSVVERHLAKVNVASSNLVSRSKYVITYSINKCL